MRWILALLLLIVATPAFGQGQWCSESDKQGQCGLTAVNAGFQAYTTDNATTQSQMINVTGCDRTDILWDPELGGSGTTTTASYYRCPWLGSFTANLSNCTLLGNLSNVSNVSLNQSADYIVIGNIGNAGALKWEAEVRCIQGPGARIGTQSQGVDQPRLGTYNFDDSFTVTPILGEDKFTLGVTPTAGSGDEITVNGTAVDSTGDFRSTASIQMTHIDGPPGGPDGIEASLLAVALSNLNGVCPGPTQIVEYGGGGIASCIATPTGGGGGTPGGNDGEIQFNSVGSFAGWTNSSVAGSQLTIQGGGAIVPGGVLGNSGSILATRVDAVGAGQLQIGSPDVTQLTLQTDLIFLQEAQLAILNDGLIDLGSEVTGNLALGSLDTVCPGPDQMVEYGASGVASCIATPTGGGGSLPGVRIDWDPDEVGSASAGLQEAIDACVALNASGNGCDIIQRPGSPYPMTRTWGTDPAIIATIDGSVDGIAANNIRIRCAGGSPVTLASGTSQDTTLETGTIAWLSVRQADGIEVDGCSVTLEDTGSATAPAAVVLVYQGVNDMVIRDSFLEATTSPREWRGIWGLPNITPPTNITGLEITGNSIYTIGRAIEIKNAAVTGRQTASGPSRGIRIANNHMDARHRLPLSSSIPFSCVNVRGEGATITGNTCDRSGQYLTSGDTAGHCYWISTTATSYDTAAPYEFYTGAVVTGNSCIGIPNGRNGIQITGAQYGTVAGNFLSGGYCDGDTAHACADHLDCDAAQDCIEANACGVRLEAGSADNQGGSHGWSITGNTFGPGRDGAGGFSDNDQFAAICIDPEGGTDPDETAGNLVAHNTIHVRDAADDGIACGPTCDAAGVETVKARNIIRDNNVPGRDLGESTSYAKPVYVEPGNNGVRHDVRQSPIPLVVEMPEAAQNWTFYKAPFDVSLRDIQCIVDPDNTGETCAVTLERRSAVGTLIESAATVTCGNDGNDIGPTITSAALARGEWYSANIGTCDATVQILTMDFYF